MALHELTAKVVTIAGQPIEGVVVVVNLAGGGPAYIRKVGDDITVLPDAEHVETDATGLATIPAIYASSDYLNGRGYAAMLTHDGATYSLPFDMPDGDYRLFAP